MKKYLVEATKKIISIYDERWYTIEIVKDGKKIEVVCPSVTTYLEAYPKGLGYELWLQRTKDPYVVRDEAAQLGTDVHSMIQQILLGNTISYEENKTKLEAWERVLSWCRWWKEYTTESKVEYQKEHVEYIVYSEQLNCAGTIDLLAKVNGKYRVHDWKTGSFLGDTADIQVSVYDYIIQEYLDKDEGETEFPLIVQVSPDLNKKGYRSHPVEDRKSKVEDFKHCQHIWHAANKNAKPKYKIYPMELNLEYLKNNDVIKTKEEK